jgi:hypothetical protein
VGVYGLTNGPDNRFVNYASTGSHDQGLYRSLTTVSNGDLENLGVGEHFQYALFHGIGDFNGR